MELVDMAEERALGAGLPSPCAPMNPYPWGLRLNITHEQLEKLGYSELPPAGTECRIEAVATVVKCTSEDPDADGDCDYSCIELQIKELGMEQEGDSEEEESPDADHAKDDEASDYSRAERMYKNGKQPA